MAMLVGAVAAVALGAAYVAQRPADQPPKVIAAAHPDTISPKPATGQHSAIDSTAALPIRYAKSGPASRRFPTMPEALAQIAAGPHAGAAAFKFEARPYPADRAGDFTTVTYRQYNEHVRRFAKALLSLRFKNGDGVAICGFNDPAWIYAHMGCIAAGGLSAGTYPTNSAELCAFVAADSNSVVAVCDTMANAAKYIAMRAQLPKLRHVVVYTDSVPAAHADAQSGFLLSYDAFVAKGNAVSDEDLAQRMATYTSANTCALIYTSGTTGNPKGVMMTHDNNFFTACAGLMGVEAPRVAHSTISYLPMSHIAGQLLDVTMPLFFSFEGLPWTVHFARPDVMKGSLPLTLKAVQPTLFFGVPRVWEKFVEGIKAKARAAPATGVKKALVDWAKSVGTANSVALQIGHDGVLCRGTALADKLVFSKVREALGLTRCSRFYTGAAPTTRETFEFLAMLGINLCEVFGMSETCGLGAASGANSFLFGSCGSTMIGTELKIDHDAVRGDKPGQGEICFRGRQVMTGYLNNRQKTDEAIDADGWMHSGDLGSFDKHGMLYITGRLKELIITAGGENIAPVPIEQDILRALPGLSNVVLIGDKRKYNVVLVTLRMKLNSDTGDFVDELIAESKDVNPAVTTVAAAAADPAWKAYIEAGIKRYNAAAPSNAQKVQKFAILPTDLSVAQGDLTATLKLKRSVLCDKYAAIIESLYADGSD